MQIIPVHDYGLLLSPDVAPYFILAAGRKTGHIPDELHAAEQDGSFETRATWRQPNCVFEDKTLYSMWRAKEDIEDAFGKDAPDIQSVSDFEGIASTIPEKDAPLDAAGDPIVENGIQYDYGDRHGGQDIVYMPLDRAPTMYAAAYEDKAAMVREMAGKLKLLGVELPGGETTIAQFLVELSGTTVV